MLGVEIQGTSSRNCSPGAPRSNQASRPSEAAKMPSELTSAQKRLLCADHGGGRQRAMRKSAGGGGVEPGGRGERGGKNAERTDERPEAAALRRRRARQAEGDEERGQWQDEDQGEEVHRGRPPKRPMATMSATEPKRIQVA